MLCTTNSDIAPRSKRSIADVRNQSCGGLRSKTIDFDKDGASGPDLPLASGRSGRLSLLLRGTGLSDGTGLRLSAAVDMTTVWHHGNGHDLLSLSISDVGQADLSPLPGSCTAM